MSVTLNAFRGPLCTFASILLTACAQQGDEPRGEAIDCALDGAAKFEKVCLLELDRDSGRFVLHRPDGGFRRIEIDPDGGWQPADGADELTVATESGADRVEFALGADRYAIPLSLLPERTDD